MARRIVLIVLWVLLSAAGRALAADDFKAPDLSDIRRSTSRLKQSQQDQASDALPARLSQEEAYRQSLATILDADLTLSNLRDRGWRDGDFPALAEAIRLASQAVKALHAKHPSPVADAYGSNTLTNLEHSFKTFAGTRGDRGCLSHQAETISALAGVRSALDVKRLMIGDGLVEHHAVIIYPKGADWEKAGVVLDGWPNQSDVPRKMTLTVDHWQSQFFTLRYLELDPIVFQAGPRLED
jgi:hypothetical protein